MRKIVLAFVSTCLFITGLSGCSSQQNIPVIEQEKLSEQFQLPNVSLTLTESFTPKTQYHSESEFQELINSGIQKNLKESNLISSNASANSIDIKITYHRKFILDGTPLVTNALRYPSFDYIINVKDGNKTIRTITRDKLLFMGGFFTNMKSIFGGFNEKEDELIFITALNEKLAKEIKNLK